MDGFDNFTMYIEKQNEPFITLRPTTITFSIVAIELLNYSEFVHMFVDEKNKKVAFKACPKEKGAIQFYAKRDESKQILVRLAGKEKINLLMRLASIEDCGKGIRYYGYYDQNNEALIFDMDQYNK